MDSKEYFDQIQQLGKRMVDEGTLAWERYIQSLSSTHADQNDFEGMQRDYIDFAKEQGTEYMRKIMQCNMDYYNGVVNAGMDFSHDMMDKVLKKGPQQPSASTSAPSDEQVTASKGHTELHFHGKKGAPVLQSFMMANNQDKPVKVSFEISEFISEDGKRKIRLPVAFKPDSFELEPGAEQLVECRVNLERELDSDQQHAALARVSGFPDMMVRLVVSIEE